jgi:hypothetical protein
MHEAYSREAINRPLHVIHATSHRFCRSLKLGRFMLLKCELRSSVFCWIAICEQDESKLNKLQKLLGISRTKSRSTVFPIFPILKRLRTARSRGRNSNPGGGQEFSLLDIVQAGSGAHPAYQWVLELKRQGREADHSPPTSAEVKKTPIYTSTASYVFTAQCLIR